MQTIVINALNSNSGGGRSIRDSFLKLLNEETLEDRYVVLVAPGAQLDFVQNRSIRIEELPAGYARTIAAPLVYELLLGRVLKRLNADVVLNLGDLVVNTSIPQIYVFDWPYAIDVEPGIWRQMGTADWASRRSKLILLERSFRKPAIVVAQTEYIRDRLKQKYHLKRVEVIGNSVTLNEGGETYRDFGLPTGINLVCPSVYYPHKNIDILLDVAERVRESGLGYRFVVTVAPTSAAAAGFVRAIDSRGLQDFVINAGQVDPRLMPSLYRQCDGLILPTLLESFSIVYPEAMHFGLPILTSDRWFARSVCGEAARYFDPNDPASILSAITDVFGPVGTREFLVTAGHKQLATFPDWPKNFAAFLALIRELLPAKPV
jgi:glycosyltransferase involved in cell wall biosynthesis